MNLTSRSEKEDGFARLDSPKLCDLLDEVAEEIEIDWPEFLPVERIAPGIMKIALGSLLFIGLVAFCAYQLKARLADSLGKEREPSPRVLLERAFDRSNVGYYAW
jgi:hypothetical protein